MVTAGGNTEYVITPLAIFKRDKNGGRLKLYSVFPHSTVEDVIENTGFTVEKHEQFHPFPAITDEEKTLLEEINRYGSRYSEFR